MTIAGPWPERLRDLKVLLVEDEAILSMVFEEVLGDAGARVLGPAATVEEALDLIEAAMADGGLDVAVLDVNLGGETAAPVANRLARLAVPFLVATGYDGNGGLGHHQVPTLRKPFSLEDLLAAVAGVAGVRPGRTAALPLEPGSDRRRGALP